MHIAFNNAGVDYPPAAIADTDIAEFDDLMTTNARGVFLGMKYEIPHLLKTGGVKTSMLDRVQRDWGVSEAQLVKPYPMQRVAQPEEIAQVVMWLASPAASYVSGMRFDIDGGGLG